MKEERVVEGTGIPLASTRQYYYIVFVRLFVGEVPPEHQTLHDQSDIHIEETRKLFGDGVTRIGEVVKEALVSIFGGDSWIEGAMCNFIEFQLVMQKFVLHQVRANPVKLVSFQVSLVVLVYLEVYSSSSRLEVPSFVHISETKLVNCFTEGIH